MFTERCLDTSLVSTHYMLVAPCYRLNVCVPPKFICWYLNPQGDTISRWDPWKVVRSWEQRLMNGNNILIKAVVFPIVMYGCESWTIKKAWASKNWCFQIVALEKTLESILECKEIKPINPTGNQPWIFIGRTAAEAEAPILRPLDVKSQLIGKDTDAWEEGVPWWLSGKEPTCQCRRTRDAGLIPVSWRSLEEGMATHSSILAWRIPWSEEPIRLQRVRHDWCDLVDMHTLEERVKAKGKGGCRGWHG